MQDRIRSQVGSEVKGFASALNLTVVASLRRRGLTARGRPGSRLAAALLLLAGLLLFAACLVVGSASTWQALPLAAALGLQVAIVQMAIMHDAVHRAFCRSRAGNRMLSLLLALAGGSPSLWYRDHVIVHHQNTNIHGLDHDLETGGLLRLHSAQRWRPHHRFQHLYAWFLYSLVSLNWCWIADATHLVAQLARNPFGLSSGARTWLALEVVLVKLAHAALFLLLPAWLGSWDAAIVLYLVYSLVLGSCLGVTIQLAHVSNVQALPAGIEELPRDFAIRQLATTANFAPCNRLLTWAVGGLNHQIEHHLFPGMSSRNYAAIAPVVKAYCQERGVTYHEFPTFGSALRAHYAHLRRLGRGQEQRAGVGRRQRANAATVAAAPR